MGAYEVGYFTQPGTINAFSQSSAHWCQIFDLVRFISKWVSDFVGC